jgi:hypothetical protein
MKHKILIALFLLFTVIVNAQLTTNLLVNARPPATLSKWATTRGTVTLLVNSIGGGTQGGRRVKIKTVVKASDGTEVSTTNMNLAPVIILKDGQNILDVTSVYPLEIQLFTGKFQNSLNRTGKIPADNYQLCVELVEEATFAPLTPQQCKSFYVAAMQLPICMMPANEQELNANVARTAITFRWTPLVPKPQGATNYRLQVFEVLENQTPMQALRSNQPLLDKIIIERTQFIWQPQLGLMNNDNADSASTKNGNRFIWSVQTLDALGTPFGIDGNNEGRSEPIVFTIKNKNDKITFPPSAKAVSSCCNNSTWGAKMYGNSSTPNTLPACGSVIGGGISANLFLNVTYNCPAGCLAQVEYTITGPGGYFWTSGLVSATTAATTFTAHGLYKLKITPYCGGIQCGIPCKYKFQY